MSTAKSREMAKVKFWALCSDLIKEEFSKDMLHPGRIEKAWADRRRKEIELEDGSREVHLFTEFRRRVGIWISFLDGNLKMLVSCN